jgi:hypothetical protein
MYRCVVNNDRLTGQHLHVAQRAARSMHKPRSFGDERPPTGMG